MKGFSFLLLFLCVTIRAALCQGVMYYGGTGSGSANYCHQQNISATALLYNGGNEDGVAIFCYQQTQSPGALLFNGGIDDGFATNCYLQGSISPSYNVFTGGRDDGFAVYCYQQPNALGAQLYYGGNDEASFVSCYQQSQNFSSLFYGGTENEADVVTCHQQNDYILPSYYYGGNDIFSAQVNCKEQISFQLYYYGGNDDGFSNMCYTQGLASPVYSQYTGGVGAGGINYCYTQTASLGNTLYYGGNGAGINAYCFKQRDYLFTIVLPIELLSFNAEIIDDLKVKVSWQTTSEINNDFFIVQRSSDTDHWEDIQQVNSVGNTITVNEYLVYDNSPLQGISYYRLKQVDIDGHINYSLIKSVDFKNKLRLPSELLVYPNPTEYLTNFQFSNFSSDHLAIFITDMLGQVVFQKTITLTNGTGLYGFEKLSDMAPGQYIVSVFDQNKRIAQKKLLIK